MDFLTDVPTATELFTILLVVDRFLIILVLINLGTRMGTEVVEHAFFECIVSIHGLSYMIISDRDPCFVG